MSEEEFVFDGMTPELRSYIDHAKTYLERNQNGEHQEWKSESEMLEKLLPDGLKSLYDRKKKEWMCRDATATGEPVVHKSDSGKYELHITRHSTGKNSWNYSKGKVYRGGVLIAEVCRNYGSFPFLFIEGHPNGNDYLIAGEDYQGQVVIELNTGRRRGLLPEEAKQGYGFCWADYRFDVKSQVVIVDGCFWACDYEFKFFDFSDPMEKGWPQIEMEDFYVDVDEKWPEIDGDIFKCFESESAEDDEDEEDKPKKDPTSFKAIKTFKREGLKLTLTDEWVSEAEQKRRKEQKEANEKHEAWKADFRANDPLYLAFKARLKSDEWLKSEAGESYGVTHDNWCPDFKERETRWCKRIHWGRSKGWTIDLDWAVKTGPVKLTLFNDGKSHSTKFFPHSVEGMNEAFDYAKTVLS
jgi:hypothetical protein